MCPFFQNFFMIGTNNDQSLYKILTIDRLKPSELDICEDPNTYNEAEYNELIEKIKEESDPNGGFNFVTDFYGIIGRSIFDLSYYLSGQYIITIITKDVFFQVLSSFWGHTTCC